MVLPGDPAIPLLSLYPEKNKNSNSKRYMHDNVHSSTIYNSQDMEAAQLPINRLTKEDVCGEGGGRENRDGEHM